MNIYNQDCLEKSLDKMLSLAIILADKCNGKYYTIVWIFSVSFILMNLSLAGLEIFIFGHRFIHLLDYIFLTIFLIYFVLNIYACWFYNNHRQRSNYE